MSASRRLAGAWIWAALCTGAVAASWWATTTGVGVTPDSTAYFATARHWLEQWHMVPLRGPSSATMYFGPLYPASLAAASIVLRQDPGDAARWLNLLVFPINLLLLGLVLRRAVPSSPKLPWIGALIFLMTADILRIHSNALSEPAFLSLLLLGFCAIDRCVEPEAGVSRRMALSVVLAAACLQRSAGAALVLTASASIVFWAKGPLWRRVVWAAIVGALGLWPSSAWGRSHPGFQAPAFHLAELSWFLDWWPALSQWVVPSAILVSVTVREWLALVVVLLAVAFVVVHRSAPDRSATAERVHSRIPSILVLFAVVYIVALWWAASFWDALIVPDSRLFAPLWLSAMLLVLIGIARLWPRASLASPSMAVRVMRRTATAFAAVWLLATAVEAVVWLVVVHGEGQGYNGVVWKDSPTILAVEALPPETFLVSAANDAVTAVTGRPARRLPDRENPATRVPNPEYETELKKLHQQLIDRSGVVVIFDRMTKARPYIPGLDDLLRTWSLRLVVRTKDGGLYRVDSSAESSRPADPGSP